MPSNNLLVMPVEGQPLEYRHVAQLVGRDLGVESYGAKVNHVSYSSATEYAHTLRNRGVGGHINVLRSSDGLQLFSITDTETFVRDLSVDALNVNVLTAVSATISTIFAGTINATLVNAGTGSFTILAISGAATFDGAITANSTAQFNGHVQIGNATSDTLTVLSTTTFTDATGSTIAFYVDAANQRAIVGSNAALGSDTTPNLQVRGRLYVAPNVANDQAIQWRRSVAATVGWWLGEASDGRTAIKDKSTTTVVNIGQASDTYQLQVVGDCNVTDDAVIAGDISADRGVFGTTSFTGSEKLRVSGQSQLDGAVTISTGGLGVTGSSVFNSAVSIVSGGLSIIGGLTINAGATTAFIISNPSVSLTATAGGASHVAPAQYLLVNVGGSNYKIALYNP